MARVLLADSQPLFNEALEALFARDGEHKVIGCCSSRSEAFAMLQSLEPDLVLVDATIGLGERPSLVDRLLHERPTTKVVVLGDDHDPNLLLAALRAGAAGAVGKTYGADTVLRVAVSQHTVRTHIQNILEKLGMHSKLEAAAFAMRWSFELDADGRGEGRAGQARAEGSTVPRGGAPAGRAELAGSGYG